ncbi:MAG: phosphoribosyltransferase family protein [Nanoarchaeota archaeon]
MDLLLELLRREGIVKKGEVKLSSGEISDVYYDVKKAYGNPALLSSLARRVYHQRNGDINFVAGFGIGGGPLAIAISLLYNIPLTIIRNEKKKHGTKREIECYVPNSPDIGMVVDDVFTTGTSLLSTVKTIEKTGAKISECYVVLKREDRPFEYPLRHLFVPEDFIF